MSTKTGTPTISTSTTEDTLPESGLEMMRAAARGELEAPPIVRLLGWEALSIEPGLVRIRYQARPEFCNPMGNIQGGMLAAMLDDAMGPAAVTFLDAWSFTPTLEMKVNFLRPALPGTLLAEGRVTHRTSRFMFLEGKLETEDGTLIATASATSTIISRQGT